MKSAKSRKLITISTLFVLVLAVLAFPWAAEAKPKGGWIKPTWDEETAFEIELGKKLYNLAVERGGNAIQAGKLQYPVADIFDDLAREAKRYRFMPYRLTILSSGEIDAWSLPGGDVFVTLGLIRSMKYADELAGVFAHELAHVVAGDNVQQVTSQKGQEILEKIASGGLPATMESLGVYGAAVLGYGYASNLDKDADDFAKRLLKDSRYDPRGVNFALWRIRDTDKKSRYLRTHPHPGLSPMEPQAPVAVPPVMVPPVVIVPVPTPTPAPAPVPRVTRPRDEQPGETGRERERQPQMPRKPYNGPSFVLRAFGGVTPLEIPAQTVTGTIQLSTGVPWEFPLTQPGAKNPALIGLGGDLRWPNRLELGFRFGFLSGVQLFTGSAGSAFNLEGSLGRVLVKGDMFSLSLGAFGDYTAVSGTAGTFPADAPSGIGTYPDDYMFDPSTPIKARSSGFGSGLYLNMGGSIGDGGGLGWFADGRYQFLQGGRYAFSAVEQGGTEVALKVEGSEQLKPFTARGPGLTAGLQYRF
ncbi:MAG: M48 family metalloprotease [Firmicutes bacterium]|nr:M48 family metalloprotease [Bacillota bacterium]